VLPLVLALFAAALPLPKRPDRLLFAILALLAGLIATGTPLNLLLFYAVPGYAALANPGRVLVVYALGVCALAAFGLDALFDADIPAPAKRRAALIAVAVPLFAAAWGVSLSAAWAREAVPATTYAALLAQAAERTLQPDRAQQHRNQQGQHGHVERYGHAGHAPLAAMRALSPSMRTA